MRASLATKSGHVLAHQRFAAGQPDLVDAHRREQADEPFDLLEAENLVAAKPLESLRGHAVTAAEVAPVGDGDADASDLPPPAVDERRPGAAAAEGV